MDDGKEGLQQVAERSVTEEDKKLLTGEEGKRILKQVKEAVRNEYERLRMEWPEGGKEIDVKLANTVRLQEKHIDIVEQLAVQGAKLVKGDLSEWQLNLIRMEAILHDALKIAPEGMEIDGNADLRLFTHGQDSAEWAEQLLGDMGFSKELGEKVSKDIEAHMGMPYVEQSLKYKKEELDEVPDKMTAERLPSDFPDPDNFEAAVLYTADLLSPVILAGADLTNDREAGCLDRYTTINLHILSANTGGGGALGEAFEMSVVSVDMNMERLYEGSGKENKTEEVRAAERVEREIAIKLGGQIRDKIGQFKQYVDKHAQEIFDRFGIVGGDKGTAYSWYRAVLNSCTVYDEKQATSGGIYQAVNIEKTMDRYYQIVGMFREWITREKQREGSPFYQVDLDPLIWQ